jgi:hypothetical protein
MEVQFKTHVRVICDLAVGMNCWIKGYGRPLSDNTMYIIEDIKFQPGCESSFMVKINGYASYIDSNWITL